MEVITGFQYPGFNLFEFYPVVCIANDKPNRVKPVLLSTVSGYPTGEV